MKNMKNKMIKVKNLKMIPKHRYYHLSSWSPRLRVLKPRIPTNPYCNSHGIIVEDVTTARTCFSHDVRLALFGVSHLDGAGWDYDRYFVYGTNRLQRLLVPVPPPVDDVDDILDVPPGRDPFKHQVPDASDTSEVWSRAPTRARCLGVLVRRDDATGWEFVTIKGYHGA